MLIGTLVQQNGRENHERKCTPLYFTRSELRRYSLVWLHGYRACMVYILNIDSFNYGRRWSAIWWCRRWRSAIPIDEVCFGLLPHNFPNLYNSILYAYKLKNEKSIAKFIRTNDGECISYDVMPLRCGTLCHGECANTKSPSIDAKHKIDCLMHFNGP